MYAFCASMDIRRKRPSSEPLAVSAAVSRLSGLCEEVDMRRTTTLLLAATLLVVMAVPAGARGGWQPGALTFTGGPGCDFNQNGIDDGFLDHGGIGHVEGPLDGHIPIPFEYRLAGKLKADVLDGKYTMRFDNAHYYQNEDTNSTPVGVPEEILVTGDVTMIGELTSTDFSDVSAVAPVGDTMTLKWSYTITDIDGVFLAVTGGTLALDTTTGDVTYNGAYGPCEQP
jgi:hypothetical protein